MRSFAIIFIQASLLLVLASTTSNAQNGGQPEAPEDFDCAIRQLAMDYAVQIQPNRSRALLGVMAEALGEKGGLPGGRTICPHAPSIPKTAKKEALPAIPLPIASNSSLVVFVDPDHGHDSNANGTKEAPFRSLERGIKASRFRTMQQQSATIVLRQGTHRISKTIEINPQDKNLTFQAYTGEEVWVSGATELKVDAWERVPDREGVWQTKVHNPPSSSSFKGLRIKHKRAVLARYPNGCVDDKLMPSKYSCSGFSKNGSVVLPEDGFGTQTVGHWIPPPRVTMESSTQYDASIAPTRDDDSYFSIFKLGINGTCSIFTPPVGYWCSNACTGGAPKPPDCKFRTPIGLLDVKRALPNSPYAKPQNARVYAWHSGHWSSWAFDVGQGNATHLMFSKGGFQGARGGDRGEAFYIENVLEELDALNEYFYDADEHTLYYKSGDSPPPTTQIEALGVKTLFKLGGKEGSLVHNIHFLGLGFRDTSSTIMTPHTVPSGGDWALALESVVHAHYVDGLVIEQSHFFNVDGGAILVRGLARNVVIKDNIFRYVGETIIALLGETSAPGLPKDWGFGWDGRAGNQPRGSLITGNFAYKCGLYQKQSSFIFQAKSMQTRIEKNIFFDGPRAGINLNDGFGGYNVIANNILFNTVKESGDHAPINTWDRQVYAHETLFDGTPNTRKVADNIYGNYIMGNYYAQEDVDNDDGSGYFNTHDNVMVYGERGEKSDFGGHDNNHHDNVYLFFAKELTMIHQKQVAGHGNSFMHNYAVMRHDNGMAAYDCACESKGICPRIAYNRVFSPNATYGLICGETLKERQTRGLDLGTTINMWPTTQEMIDVSMKTLNMVSVSLPEGLISGGASGGLRATDVAALE